MRILVLTLLSAVSLLAQTTRVDLVSQAGGPRITLATAAPGTCTVGDLFFDTDATAGRNWYGCTATNTWTLQGDGGGADDTAYDATSWNANTDAPTKNVVRDKIETLAPLISPTLVTPNIGAATGTSIALATNPASAGAVRIPNNTATCWRNAANSGDFCMKLNVSNEFELDAPLNITGSANAMLLTGVTSPSAPAGAEQVYFYWDSADNLPKWIYNGESEKVFALGNASGVAVGEDTAYNESTWNAATEAPTKNAVRDQFEAEPAATRTLTNKTLDVEGTGNSITTVSKVWLPAAACQNTTASLFWDTPTSNPAVAACVTGTNTQKGVADFADGSSLSMQQTLLLPSDFTGAIDAKFKWLTSATSGDVVWQIQTICVADAETDDPAFNTASTVTDTAKGTTLQTNDASITGVTATGCAAGELLHVKVLRDAAHASDSLAATARLIGVELTFRRAQ